MSNLATITNNILADSGIDDINVIVSTGSYANPAWITSLAWTKITGAPLGDYLPLVGGTMTGNINWAQTDRGITWSFNTDGASIKFYNTGDGDTDSRLEFATVDNNNEYFRWVHIPDGGTLYESMRLVPNSSGNAQLLVSGSAGIGTNSITNGTTFGGGGQVNRLKVQSSNYTALEINSSTSGGSIQFTYGTNLPNQVSGLIGYNYANGTVNEFSISNVLSGPMVFATTNVEAMRIFAGRNVHIGPTPISDNGARLQVSGLASFNGGLNTYHVVSIKSSNTLTYGGLGVYSSSNDRFINIQHTGTEGFIETENAGSGVMTPLSFKTGGTTRLTIASTGAATFSSSVTANGIINRVNAAGTDGYIVNTTTGVQNTVMGFNNSGATNAQGVLNNYSYFGNLNTYGLQFTTSGAVAMTITTSGNVGIGTPSPTNSRLLIAGTHVSGNSILGVVPVGNQVATIGVYNSAGARRGLFYSDTGFVRIESDADPIQIAPAGTIALTLATTGAATFSSNVTTTGGFLQFPNNYGVEGRNAANTAHRTVLKLNTSNQIEIGRDTDISSIILGTASAVNALTIASTGAATFSSSVTTGTDVTLNNGTLFVSAGSGQAYSSRLLTAYIFPYITTYLDSFAGPSWEGRLQFRTNSSNGAMNTQLTILNSGAATFSGLAGSGNRIVVANSSGTLISAVIGSGLAFDGTTLTATGGGSGSISGSGTSGTVALFTGATSIGNSVITQSGSTIGITSGITDSAVTFTNSTAYSTSNNYSLTYRSTTASFGIQPIANIVFDTVGDAASQIRFVTRANAPDYNTRMTITSVGNVGIGASSVTASRLRVEGATSEGTSIADFISNDTTASAVYHRGIRVLAPSLPVGDKILMSVGVADNTRNMGQLYFNYVGNGSVSNYLSLGLFAVDEVLNITGAGNVLVGTTTDNGAKLRVSGSGVAFDFTTSNGLIGNINSSAANGGYVTWQTSGTTIADLGTAQQVFGAGGNDTFGINARGARSLILGTNNTGRLTISSTGAATFSSNVAAGSTSSGAQINVFASSYGNNGLFNAYGTDNFIKLQMGALGTNEGFIFTGSGNKISFFSGGNLALTLNSNQTATFSSSVTANTLLTVNTPASGSGVIFRHVSGTNNPGLFIETVESSRNVRLTASGSLVSGQLLQLGAEGNAGVLNIGVSNVGIGAPSPTHKLQVLGSSDSGIRLTDSSGNTRALLNPSGVQHGEFTLFNNSGNATTYLGGGGGSNYVMAQGGNFLIGTQTDNGNRLRVNGTIFSDSSITATSFFESSDASLKTLIADNYQAKGIDSVIAKLYIKNGKEELGYFAQDLQDVLPSAVSKGSDGLLNLSYREVHTAKIAYLEERIKQLEKKYENN